MARVAGGTPELSIPPDERLHGVIVTLEHDDGPPLLSFHKPGRVTDAMRAAVFACDALGASWRIVSISTPRSIFRDLQGPRTMREREPRADETQREGHDPRDFEARELSKLGRLDLLKPLRFTLPSMDSMSPPQNRRRNRPMDMLGERSV